LTVEISVQLRPDVALALQGEGGGMPEAEELGRRAEALGVQLQPVHPGETDPLLAPYFYCEAPDEDAERIAAELAALPGVEGAYVKPAAEPP
jgi:hypothetical protein